MRPKQKILEFINQAYEEVTGARIVRPDGSAIRRLLVDKQTGDVQFAGR